jgi:2-polyprenyl-3-methyl-5-hydroxy-6-metoxy-1,4-benzoquinol methylase
MTTGANHLTELSPERVNPQEMAGLLMESEHRGRYWWATQLVEGGTVLDAGCGTGYGTEILAAAAERVVGIDISQEAIDYAHSHYEQSSSEFSVGDLRALPFEEDTFDLVVSFEVIEHIEEQQLVISELHRVLRPKGVLVISSPNRAVYPSGNPHHIHEYLPEEFQQALESEFRHVALYRQSPWLAAAILNDKESQRMGSEAEMALRTIKTRSIEPGAETFTIALASDSELPSPAGLAVMGDPFELGWWEEKLRLVTLDRDRERAQHEHQLAQHEGERLEQGRALLAVEAHLAGARDEIAQLLAAEADLKRWVEQVRRAAERVAQREARALERGKDFENRLRRAERTMDDITGSLSWRITAPLRAVMRLLRR